VHRGRVPQVTDGYLGAPSGGAYALSGVGRPVGIEVIDDDIGAVLGKAQGDRSSDATTGSGHQGAPSCENTHVSHFTAPNVRPLTR